MNVDELIKFRSKASNAACVRAERIAIAALKHLNSPDITADIDNNLSMYLTLRNKNLLMVEIAGSGKIDASLYDDKDALLRRMPEANERDIIRLIEENPNAKVSQEANND